jgi:hypothetical protein
MGFYWRSKLLTGEEEADSGGDPPSPKKNRY